MARALGLAGLRVEKTEHYVWRFSIGYVAERLGRYLPVGALVRLISRTRAGGRLFGVKVRVNLGDSDIYYVGKAK
jgi:hypothetical protein